MKKLFQKYRIVYVDDRSSLCHWQIHKRKWMFFWKNLHLNFSNREHAELHIRLLEKQHEI